MAAATRSAIGSGFRSPSPLAPSCFSDFPAAGVWRRAAFAISTVRTQMAEDVRKIALLLIYMLRVQQRTSEHKFNCCRECSQIALH